MVRPAPVELSAEPLLVLLTGGVALLLAARWRAALRDGTAPGPGGGAAALVAVVLLATTTLGPIATVAGSWLLTAHLLQVIVLMGFVPPLLLLGCPPGRRRWPRALVWLGDLAVHPAVAIVLVNGVFFAWHVPAVYDACLRHPALYATQIASLLGVSVLFWWPVVEPRGHRRWSLSPLLKLGFILLATIPQTFAGLIFALAHRPFYSGYGGGLLGLTALSDQQVAGACLALVSKVALFAAFSIVLWRFLRDEEATEDRRGGDDGGGPDDGDAPTPVRPTLPAWVRMLPGGRLAEEPAGRRPRTREAVGAGR